MPIKMVFARQIIDATGVPTVEVDIMTEIGLFRAAVPSTDIKKSFERSQLRDTHKPDYNSLGVLQAVQNINNIVAPELIKQNIVETMQKEIDHFLISLDGTENRTKIGANAMMAISIAVTKAAAAKKGMPVYKHIADLAGNPNTNFTIPVPHFLILTGGKLADNLLPFQEYLIVPTGAQNFAEALKMGVEVYGYVKKIVRQVYGLNSTYVSDCGGFSLPLETHRDALLFLLDVIKNCNLQGKVEIAINACADDMYKSSMYDLQVKDSSSSLVEFTSPEGLGELYLNNVKEFPICSVEDGFSSIDWSTWAAFNARTPIQLLANDFTQTDLTRIQMAIEKNACNAIALRINQAGTLSEVIHAYRLIKQAGLGCAVIDRWGDTEDWFLADMAVGLSATQVKCGAPVHSERVGKYNQILRIEEELGPLGKFAGKNFRLSPNI